MQHIQLIPSTTSDIPMIAALAAEIWKAYYPVIISEQQITYMLNMMYSNESLTEQMTTRAHRFCLIRVEGKTEGFLSTSEVSPGAWHLNKFYIRASYTGKGVGHLAFKDVVALLKPHQMTLTVNRQNFKAINFYFKCGFKIEQVADFDIGGGYVMNDFVMKWVN